MCCSWKATLYKGKGHWWKGTSAVALIVNFKLFNCLNAFDEDGLGRESRSCWSCLSFLLDLVSLVHCVQFSNRSQRMQNVVRTSVTHSAAPRVPLFCSYHILMSSVIYYLTDTQQHGIYLLNGAHGCIRKLLGWECMTLLSFIVIFLWHLQGFKHSRVWWWWRMWYWWVGFFR